MSDQLLVNGRPIDYSTVPAAHMRDAVQRYLEQGIPGGSFLMAVVENDLIRAAACADDVNRHLLFEWAGWFYNYAPAGSYGSRESADHWMKYRQSLLRERIAQ